MKRMQKQLGLILGVVMAVSLIGCGKSEPDPNSGLYEAQSAEMMGMSMDVSDMFENGVSLELKDGGKAVIDLDGETGKMKWTLEGDSFHAEGGGVELDGTLADGVLTLENMMDMGLNMTLVCKELANAAGDSGYSAPESVLERLKDVENGIAVYETGEDPYFADDWDDETYPDDWDWDDEAGGETASDAAVSEFAQARGLDASWFGEGVADAETLAGFYIWWADELSMNEKEEMYDRYMEVLEERIGCRPQDAMDDNDDLDRAEFRYETPDGDGSLLILLTKRDDGSWKPASISPGGIVNTTVDALRGE